MKLSSIEANIELEDGGARIEWPDYPGEVYATVRSVHYPPFVEAVAAFNARLRREHGGKRVPTRISSVGYAKLVTKHLWLSIEGLTDDKDKPIELTDQLREMVATDRKYRNLMDFITWATVRVGELDTEQGAEDEGN